MSTETGSKFLVNKHVEKMNPSVGPKEISGFFSFRFFLNLLM